MKYATMRMRWSVAMWCLLAMLAGCESVEQLTSSSSGKADQSQAAAYADQDLNEPQRELRQRTANYERTVGEGALIGAAAGGALGAWVGSELGGTWGGIAGGAIGGLAGAELGKAAGEYYAEKKEDAASKEDVLNAMIADVQAENRRTDELIDTWQTVVNEDKKKLASLNRQLKSNQIKSSDYERQIAVIRADRSEMEKGFEAANKKLALYQQGVEKFSQDYPGTSTAALDDDLAEYEGKIRTMRDISNELIF